MALEREHLLPLAKEGFNLAAVRFPAVNSSGCVKVLTNFYSVPLATGTEVEAKIHAAYIEVWHQGRCVARHERCFLRQQKVLDLEHYLEVLEKKPGAVGRINRVGTMACARKMAGQLRPVLGGSQTKAGQARRKSRHDRDPANGPAAWLCPFTAGY